MELKGDLMNWRLSRHADLRRRQRSVRERDLATFLELADQWETRRGATRLRLSRRSAEEALAEGMNRERVARARRLVTVISAGTIITVYRRGGR
jgi:hypothetical protein